MAWRATRHIFAIPIPVCAIELNWVAVRGEVLGTAPTKSFIIIVFKCWSRASPAGKQPRPRISTTVRRNHFQSHLNDDWTHWRHRNPDGERRREDWRSRIILIRVNGDLLWKYTPEFNKWGATAVISAVRTRSSFLRSSWDFSCIACTCPD